MALTRIQVPKGLLIRGQRANKKGFLVDTYCSVWSHAINCAHGAFLELLHIKRIHRLEGTFDVILWEHLLKKEKTIRSTFHLRKSEPANDRWRAYLVAGTLSQVTGMQVPLPGHLVRHDTVVVLAVTAVVVVVLSWQKQARKTLTTNLQANQPTSRPANQPAHQPTNQPTSKTSNQPTNLLDMQTLRYSHPLTSSPQSNQSWLSSTSLLKIWTWSKSMRAYAYRRLMGALRFDLIPYSISQRFKNIPFQRSFS